jgi:ribonuclease HI
LSKRKKAAARRRLPSLVQALVAVGGNVSMNRQAITLTVTAADGRGYAYWAMTDTWAPHGEDEQRAGFEKLQVIIRDAAATTSAMAEARSIDATIIADAAFCIMTKAGGWGAWIKAGRQAGHVTGGAFKEKMPSSNISEVAALANALAVAKCRGMIQPGATVMLQSDSTHALGLILWKIPMCISRPAAGGLEVNRPKRVSVHQRDHPALVSIAELAKEMDLKLVVRHVKGHTKGADGRHRINILCDQIAKAGKEAAKAAMRKAA